MTDSEEVPDYEYKINNVVATATVAISEKIDLIVIARKHPDTEYNPERFPGLVMRVEKTRGTILVFSTGKFVITGLKHKDHAPKVMSIVLKNLKKAGISLKDPIIEIQNLVASGNLHVTIDLNKAAILLDSAMYEPEVFPGLIYRMEDPKAVFLLFSTGSIVCTGVKTVEVVEASIKKLYQEVKELGLDNVESSYNSDDFEFS